jgi:hypothetical protein
MHRPQPILSAATSLLGICFVIITSLKLTGSNARSFADEVAWAAAALLFVAVVCAYLAIRNQGAHPLQIRLADGAFLGGLSVLALSVVIAAIWL